MIAILRQLIRTHWVACVLALATGLLMAGPQWWFALALGEEYRGINMMGSDAESHYLARMQEVVEGNGIGNPFLSEEKGRVPSSQFLVVEYLLTWPSAVLGIPVTTLNLFYKFAFPVGVFIAMYFLAWRLIGRRSAALAAASLAILGPTLFSVGQIKLLISWSDLYDGFAMYSRPVNPQFSTLWFLVYAHVLLSWWRSESPQRAGPMLGGMTLLYGLSFYIYFYTWTFITVVNGLFGAILLVRREWRKMFEIGAVTIGGLVCAIPYFRNLHAFTGHPYYPDISKTFLIEYTRELRITMAGLLCAALFAGVTAAFRKSLNAGQWMPIGVLVAAAFVVSNQQVITGIIIQEGHYHWYYNIPVFSIALAFGVAALLVRFGFEKLLWGWSAGVIALSFTSTYLIQTSSYRAWHEHTASQQRYAAVFEWLNENAEPEAVVLASNDISELVPIYTHQNVFWSNFSFTYLIPVERIAHVFMTHLALHDVAPELMPEPAFHPPVDVAPEVLAHHEIISMHGGQKTFMRGVYPDGMAARYQAFRSAPVTEHLAKYRVDYVVVDLQNEPHWLKHFERLPEAFRANNLVVFTAPAPVAR